jgi:biotin carboxylase
VTERRRVLFVCRAASGESVRAAQALQRLGNVDLTILTDVTSADEITDAALKHGSISQIITAQETLLEPVALANEQLGLPGMRSDTVRGTLDKSQLKTTLHAAGINTPRHQLVTNPSAARDFVAEIGFPIVLKSPIGSGALATLLIPSEADLHRALSLANSPLLAEQYIDGQELCIDTITIDSEPQFHSVCCYQPSILEAIEQPEVQWRCVMPREMDAYQTFIEQGLKAIKALSVGNAMTHMEGFLDSSGRPWFTDATLRPAGARIAPMLAHAYDIDPYRAWARVVVDGCFDGPWERKYAVGTLFLRGIGSGTVARIDGVEDFADLVVEQRLPQIGAEKSMSYTGDGFITIRHESTDVVHDALSAIARSIRIIYSSDAHPAADWRQRLHNYNELNRPAWDHQTERQDQLS